MQLLRSAAKHCLLCPLAVAALLGANIAVAQPPPPPELDGTKTAAENGDPSAQDKLGDRYFHTLNMKEALIWYRKAAIQGVANSQFQAATILNREGTDAYGMVANPILVDEALKWYIKSAARDFKRAQIELGRIYEDGKLLKQDYAEAYKWYFLGQNIQGVEKASAKMALDQLILKMTQDQIKEGRQRVEIFLAGGGRDMPEPLLAKWLILNDISGPDDHRLAIINGHTFEASEEALVKINGQKIRIKCLEIRKDSVLIDAEGAEKQIELKLK